MTTIRETPKALLIEMEDGRQTWIQRRWMRADGTLTPAGQAAADKAVTKTQHAEAKQSERQAETDRRNELIDLGAPARSSEKAVAYHARVCEPHTGQVIARLAWFPKSMSPDAGSFPRWLIEAKAKDVGKDVIGGRNHFSVTIESIGTHIFGEDFQGYAVAPDNWGRD
jgi:hypothetical protein